MFVKKKDVNSTRAKGAPEWRAGGAARRASKPDVLDQVSLKHLLQGIHTCSLSMTFHDFKDWTLAHLIMWGALPSQLLVQSLPASLSARWIFTHAYCSRENVETCDHCLKISSPPLSSPPKGALSSPPQGALSSPPKRALHWLLRTVIVHTVSNDVQPYVIYSWQHTRSILLRSLRPPRMEWWQSGQVLLTS